MSNFLQNGFFGVDPNATPETLNRRRSNIMGALSGRSTTGAQGLAKLIIGGIGGVQNRNMNRFEDEKRGEATDLFNRITGQQSAPSVSTRTVPQPITGATVPPVTTGPIPDTPESVGADTRAALGQDSIMPASLIRTESGGNFGALNNEMGANGVRGHGGRGQFGYARLQDAAAAGLIPAGTTPQQFAQMSPEQQIAVENWHFGEIDKAIDATGAIGSTINGVPVTRDGLRAVAHLGGVGGMRRYIATNGQYNPSDSFGTSLSDYAATHSAGGATSAPTAAQGPSQQDLMQMMANPWLSGEQRAVLGSMLSQAQQNADPMRQIQLETAQLELDRLRNPQAEPGFSLIPQDEALAMGLTDGAYQRGPDGKISKVGGGGVNVTVGGTTEIGTIPTGFELMTDPNTGARSLRPISGGPEDNSADQTAAAQAAQDSVNLIDSIINDPTLPSITGMVQGRLPPTTQAGTDLNVRIQQVQGQAFLQAFESLKGGGSITEREGQAAQAAMARLNRVQSTEAYIEALTELRDIIQRGVQRANGGNPEPAPQGLSAEDLQYLGLD